MNVEHRTSNIEHRMKKMETVSCWKTRVVVTGATHTTVVHHQCRFLRVTNSKLDVGRSMLDVHLFLFLVSLPIRFCFPVGDRNISFGVGDFDIVLIKGFFDPVRHFGNGVHPFSGVRDPDAQLEINR